jgi:CRP-like cAMP-binding protein
MMDEQDTAPENLTFQPGDVIMDQGQWARGLYVLISGSLDIIYNGVKVAEISGKGSFVGEIASVLGGKRIARVVANTPVSIRYIKNVTAYFETNPSAALMMAKTLASRIMDMNKKLVMYETAVENVIRAGEDAVKMNDLAPIKESLEEIKKFFIQKISAA